MLMATKIAFPVGHPLIANWVCANRTVTEFLKGACPTSVSNSHPDLDGAINNKSNVFPSNHLEVHDQLAPYMPASHRYVLLVLVLVLVLVLSPLVVLLKFSSCTHACA